MHWGRVARILDGKICVMFCKYNMSSHMSSVVCKAFLSLSTTTTTTNNSDVSVQNIDLACKTIHTIGVATQGFKFYLVELS